MDGCGWIFVVLLMDFWSILPDFTKGLFGLPWVTHLRKDSEALAKLRYVRVFEGFFRLNCGAQNGRAHVPRDAASQVML